MAKVEGSDGPDTIGARNGATEFADHIYGKGGGDTIHGLGGEDHLYGGEGEDKLFGGDLTDYLRGEEGDDTLSGDGGDDFLRGGSGADTLNGGPGFDYASYYGSPSGVLVNLMAGTGAGGHAAGDTLIDIENVSGSAYDDTFIGDDDGNALFGWGGSDVVKGFGGDDGIFGGEESDTLYGMNGDDVIHGNEGKDYISGGAGKDTLFGYEDGDTFAWASTAETLVNGPSYDASNTDFIGDFDPAEGDLIDLSVIDADVYAPGNQTFTFVEDAAFSGTPGELAYVHVGGDTFILMQTGTSTDVEGVIRLPGIQTPQADWFDL